MARLGAGFKTKPRRGTRTSVLVALFVLRLVKVVGGYKTTTDDDDEHYIYSSSSSFFIYFFRKCLFVVAIGTNDHILKRKN